MPTIAENWIIFIALLPLLLYAHFWIKRNKTRYPLLDQYKSLLGFTTYAILELLLITLT